GEAVHRHLLRHPQADGADLAIAAAIVGGHPHAASSLDALTRHAELGAHVDHELFDPPYIADDVDRVGQREDGVADDLAGPVPGDLAAAIDVDDRSAGVQQRALERLSPLSGG